jgi:hypothetical protein
MSIQRTQSTQSENAAREVDKPQDRPRDKVRDQPEPELVDRFRTLMQSRAETGEQHPEQKLDPRLQGREAAESANAEGQSDGGNQVATEQAVQRKGGEERDGGQQAGGDSLQPAELAALYQAQVLAREVPAAPPPAAPTAHANPQALADMLERHVRQLAISADGIEHDRGQILLRLNDATLPGTDLLLSRTERGWLLRADVRSRGSYEAIQQAAPQLAERFASRNLGTLEIDPHFHG